TSSPDTAPRALIITPRPANEVLGALRESLEAQLRQTGADDASVLANCLERVMLSCVFDMDGLWEVLADLDLDRQDARGPPATPREDGCPPCFILVTHFSSLLRGLFAQRERRAAHSAVSRVGDRLGRLSRTLPSGPLVMILNSTTEAEAEAEAEPSTRTAAAAPDPFPPGMFGAPPPRRVRPSFGVVFAQLLDMHLVCWPAPRPDTREGGDREKDHHRTRFVTIVEVLTDDMGVWQRGRGPRPSREQRWTAVDVVAGSVICAMQPA
ncbi:hypothetical protein E4U53_005025, partial [Claviceps sorghi]